MIDTLSPAVPRTRPRAMTALLASTALMNAAMALASVISTLAAGDHLGAAWGGVPNTAGIVGTGLGALLLTRVMSRRGRRAGLMLGYVAAGAGAALAVASVARHDVIGLCLGMLCLGLGNAGAQLSRYAAAELFPVGRRGFAISMVIWAGTVGAVGGPLLLMPSSDAAAGAGLPSLTGPLLLALLVCGIAAVTVTGMPGWAPQASTSRVPLRELVSTPSARSAFAVMATAQVVMVAVMTAAPLEMHLHGHGLGSVGTALSAHTLGMFVLSPLTGRLVDRLGTRPVMLGGLATLVAASALAAAGSSLPLSQTVALFLLGYGWNLSFIAGSGQLAGDLPVADRARLEGAVDAAVWGAAAVASLASTVVLSTAGYAVLAGFAGVLAALPATVLLVSPGRRRRRGAGADRGAAARRWRRPRG